MPISERQFDYTPKEHWLSLCYSTGAAEENGWKQLILIFSQKESLSSNSECIKVPSFISMCLIRNVLPEYLFLAQCPKWTANTTLQNAAF